MTPDTIYNKFLEFIQAGDWPAARAFILEHLQEFPEEVRNNILGLFLEEALLKEGGEAGAELKLQQEVLEELEDIQGAEKEIGNLQRIEELKEKLQMPPQDASQAV